MHLSQQLTKINVNSEEKKKIALQFYLNPYLKYSKLDKFLSNHKKQHKSVVS